uniref:Tubulin-specific chaperone A n=1 Tax=Kalanchoe fedtschenkoi TaxID=63787 RepID=A0A7N0U084_KALFE
MATVRNLKIKTQTCKRVIKELHYYEKEVEAEATKTAKMKDSGADPYDLKQQENVLSESRMMVHDCRKRLETALADLKGSFQIIIQAEFEESNEDAPEIAEAKEIIAQGDSVFQADEV